jgi:hypothetical protein
MHSEYYKKLIENNKEWVQERLNEDPKFFKSLENGQQPPLLWIGCADSRVPANQIIGAKPGEVFVHRNIANDKNAYYTIVNVDKYGRSSNYDSNGDQVEDFLYASIMPSSSANELTYLSFPGKISKLSLSHKSFKGLEDRIIVDKSSASAVFKAHWLFKFRNNSL